MTRNWILWYAAAIHMTWSVLLLISADAAFCTPIHSLALIVTNRVGLSAVLALASACAAFALLRRPSRMTATLLLLQQALLVATAIGAIQAIAAQQYADGVPRPWAFIAADQIQSVLIMIAHTLAVLDMHGSLKRRTN